MKENRVKISSIVESQLPSYVREEFPLIGQFLSRYYRSQEYQGGPLDIVQNIDEYIKRTTTDDFVKSTELTYPLDQFRIGNIYVESTEGFPWLWLLWGGSGFHRGPFETPLRGADALVSQDLLESFGNRQ